MNFLIFCNENEKNIFANENHNKDLKVIRLQFKSSKRQEITVRIKTDLKIKNILVMMINTLVDVDTLPLDVYDRSR